MTHPNSDFPKARSSDMLVDTVGDETIIYDEQRQQVHSLNLAASIVWRNSNGERSVSELAGLLGAECGIDADESLVEFALDELASAHLLSNNRVSRRGALRRLTFAGAAAVALPAVLSIIAPTPAMAASGTVLPPDPGPD